MSSHSFVYAYKASRRMCKKVTIVLAYFIISGAGREVVGWKMETEEHYFLLWIF